MTSWLWRPTVTEITLPDGSRCMQIDTPLIGVPMAEVARKLDTDKPRVDLVPVEGIDGAAAAFGFGARKYAPFNWALGFQWLRLYGAVLRHMHAWWRREAVDPESGLSHLDHALASLMMLKAHEARQLGEDNRPTYQRTAELEQRQRAELLAGHVGALHAPATTANGQNLPTAVGYVTP